LDYGLCSPHIPLEYLATLLGWETRMGFYDVTIIGEEHPSQLEMEMSIPVMQFDTQLIKSFA